MKKSSVNPGLSSIPRCLTHLLEGALVVAGNRVSRVALKRRPWVCPASFCGLFPRTPWRETPELCSPTGCVLRFLASREGLKIVAWRPFWPYVGLEPGDLPHLVEVEQEAQQGAERVWASGKFPGPRWVRCASLSLTAKAATKKSSVTLLLSPSNFGSFLGESRII